MCGLFLLLMSLCTFFIWLSLDNSQTVGFWVVFTLYAIAAIVLLKFNVWGKIECRTIKFIAIISALYSISILGSNCVSVGNMFISSRRIAFNLNEAYTKKNPVFLRILQEYGNRDLSNNYEHFSHDFCLAYDFTYHKFSDTNAISVHCYGVKRGVYDPISTAIYLFTVSITLLTLCFANFPLSPSESLASILSGRVYIIH